ncbi:MAG: nicotinate-nucleotide--dimethylbenzimidazole phosphoribosyltransferase [Selenomonadaceae bacterium]|nr:nicotinate-nucleotide--dimethylbenzimidazole phosphoribosyltransferase [Selenomonadaceae bacterium]
MKPCDFSLKTSPDIDSLETKFKATLKKIDPPSNVDIAAVTEVFTKAGFGRQELGSLLDVAASYTSITGDRQPRIPQKHTFICCADHGVYAEGVSAYPQETTLGMVRNYLISKGAVANAMSNFCRSEITVIDLGINFPSHDIPDLLNCRIASGTQNIADGPAMTRQQALLAIVTGIELAEAAAAKGARCMLPGEMGISNTTSSASIVAAVCGLTPEAATGRGTNISDTRLAHKIEVVRRILAANKPDINDGVDILRHLGGFELGAITGIILGAAAHHSFVILDGFNTGAAALMAAASCPHITGYLMTSHLAAEPAHKATLEKLNLHPYMDLRFRLGEATGSSIASRLIDIMVSAYNALAAGSDSTAVQETILPLSTLGFTIPAADASLPKGIADIGKAIPIPDEELRQSCQYYLDNLAKPIRCCGRLEDIALQLAVSANDRKPPLDIPRAILCLTAGESYNEKIAPIGAAFAQASEAKIYTMNIPDSATPEQACIIGASAVRCLREKLGLSILGIALDNPSEAFACGNEIITAAIRGIISTAAGCSMTIVLDNPDVEKIAADCTTALPAAAPYLLHVQPELLKLEVNCSGGLVAALGITLAEAALHMVNDMRTFADAGVAVAEDGPGAGVQKQH